MEPTQPVSGYIPIVVMLCLAALLAAVMVLGSHILGPHKPSRFKVAPYECGVTPVGSARERFPVRFFLVAMLFIVFDVETVFLFPWAATFGAGDKGIKLFLLGEMGVFIALLLVAYAYVWQAGALDWSDGARVQHEATPPEALAVRTPILFGNEGSGPVNLPAARPSGAANV